MNLDDLCGLVAYELGRRRVAPEDRLVEDLGAESMDLVAVLAALEDRWGVLLDETVLADLETVRDLYLRAQGAMVAPDGC